MKFRTKNNKKDLLWLEAQSSEKQKAWRQGFTLIELLISLAIVAIVTGSVLQVARFSDTHKSLVLATDEFKAALRMAQSSSLSIPNPEGEHICGYGVYIISDGNNNSYELFYTDVNNATFRANPNTCRDEAIYRDYSNAPAATVIQTFKLSDGLEFSTGVGEGIFFRAPYGEVHKNDGAEADAVRRYTIQNTNGASRSVDVNEFGKME